LPLRLAQATRFLIGLAAGVGHLLQSDSALARPVLCLERAMESADRLGSGYGAFPVRVARRNPRLAGKQCTAAKLVESDGCAAHRARRSLAGTPESISPRHGDAAAHT